MTAWTPSVSSETAGRRAATQSIFLIRWQKMSRTLCESSIARATTQAVGAFAHSALASRVARVFTPELLNRLNWALAFAAGLVTGLWINALLWIVRVPR